MDAERKGAAGVDHVQDLLAEPAMRRVRLVGQIERLEIHVEVSVDLVAGAEVHIRRGVHERSRLRRLRTSTNSGEMHYSSDQHRNTVNARPEFSYCR